MSIQLPKQNRLEKLSSLIQLIVFIAVFLLIYLFFRRFTDSAAIRILIFIADYAVTSLFLFLVIRPVLQKLLNKKADS
ncbi:MAG: hypothetical protein IKI58_12190 [Oscillospiraceae bacterium]|nr:hypothetical protein [Oscillospiraceae bacterium]